MSKFTSSDDQNEASAFLYISQISGYLIGNMTNRPGFVLSKGSNSGSNLVLPLARLFTFVPFVSIDECSFVDEECPLTDERPFDGEECSLADEKCPFASGLVTVKLSKAVGRSVFLQPGILSI